MADRPARARIPGGATMKPGTLVELINDGEDNDGEDNDRAVGIVVQTWMHNGGIDCYVAFFTEPVGDAAPEKPWIARYYATSLREVKQ